MRSLPKIKNKWVSVITFVILAVSIIAGVILVNQNQNINEKAAAVTTLFFNPAQRSVIQGQTFASNIFISSNTNLVTAIDIELTFDPTVIQLTELLPLPSIAAFTNPSTGQVYKNEIDNTAGKARFIAFVTNNISAISGTKSLLTVSGSVVSNTQTATHRINFGGLTAIAAFNEIQNVLIGTTPLYLNVTGPTASPSPTASPTASPSPTPTLSPTPTASPTPTPIVFADWDVNKDQIIDLLDIGLVINDYDSANPTNPRSDVDKDGTINVIDIGIIINHYEW